jgi:SPP1 gp7 family putative phage head morphogenesis protein
MLQSLNESITTILIRGNGPKTLSKDFAKKFNTKEYEAYRLLHTEGSFIIEQGTLKGYVEDGVEKYEILATLDSKTSEICQEQDGKLYLVKEATTGVNYPPFHVFCRTDTVPYYDGMEAGTRLARDPSTGKGYEVPADMAYEQWHDQYVTKKTEKEYSQLIGIMTSNNTKISGVSEHLIKRAIQRKVTAQNIKDALLNPLKVGKIKAGEKGNSQEYVGEEARAIINPDTGNIITLWKTSTKLKKKLKGVK